MSMKIKRNELTEYTELSDWTGAGSRDSANKSYRGPDKSPGIIYSWAMVLEIWRYKMWICCGESKASEITDVVQRSGVPSKPQQSRSEFRSYTTVGEPRLTSG
ncbi:hypothetical protein N7510_008825 [Penicillium lagena]|uniref:uncharacterized protein n=1 Tax=Penicillium lagena TaxID=94218 RepID=UPI002541AFAE|nr:uncharacterized protein N7510_008825 [Penicillium lagena]KAJ5606044.1 hypothetical protein N7510_008825 [Penicillium lagena]